MIRWHFLIIVMLLLSFEILAQDSVKTAILQPNRYEKEPKFSDDDFTVIPLREDGLALIREKNKFKGGNKTWELILLDTALQEKNSLELEIDQRKNLMGYEAVSGFLYLIFNTPENVKISIDLVSLHLASGEIRMNTINPELTLKLSHFIKVGHNFILGGYVNNEPTVLLYNPDTENSKVLPGFFQKQTELVDLRPNQNQTFNTILIDRGDRDRKKIIIKTFDASGIELLDDGILIDEKYTLQTSLASMLIREDMAILGTWGGRNARQASGFFFLPVDPFSEQKIIYTAFGELEHYLDNEKPQRAKRIKGRTQEALKIGRIPEYTSYAMPYRIEEHPTAFIMLAETYVPSSVSTNRYPDPYPYGGYGPYPFYSPWGFYPRPYNRLYYPQSFYGPNTRNTEETRITQSVLVAFDGQGKVLWDLTFKLDNIRSLSLEQITDFCVANGKIYYLYKKESELMVKTITLHSRESVDATEKLKLLRDGDEIRTEEKTTGAVRHWYGNTFYVWGQHAIRNKSSREEGSRNVFYINKVVGN
jgi:hypothetical protein